MKDNDKVQYSKQNKAKHEKLTKVPGNDTMQNVKAVFQFFCRNEFLFVWLLFCMSTQIGHLATGCPMGWAVN